MSRNGSGVQSTPNTFVSGTTITAADHNENWSDAASEITNSVAADGQTSMTGALKASNGTVALPAITFASDLDTGIYRIGANNIGVSVAGANALDISATALSGSVVATKAEMETATAAKAVTAALVQNHPGVAKAWASFIGATGAIIESHNITSIVRNGVGEWTVTIATDFESNNYAVVYGFKDATMCFLRVGPTQTVGAFGIVARNAADSLGVDPASVFFACFGDQ